MKSEFDPKKAVDNLLKRGMTLKQIFNAANNKTNAKGKKYFYQMQMVALEAFARMKEADNAK